jgi:hypothetical protein
MSGFYLIYGKLPPFSKYASEPAVETLCFAGKIICNCYKD